MVRFVSFWQLALIAAFSFFTTQDNGHKKVSKSFPANDWPLPNWPEIKKPEKSIDVPAFLFDIEKPEELAEALIKTHPEKRISVDLYGKIMNYEILVDYLPNMPSSDIMALATFSDKVDADGYFIDPKSYLAFNLFRLKVATEKDVVKLWSFLTHEYVHYLQDQVELSKGGIKKDEYLKSCESFYVTEREAYLEQCKVLNSWLSDDNINYDKLCVYESQDFDHALFNYLFYRFYSEKGTYYYNYPGCLDDWAKLAGHPQPEKFSGW